MKPIETASAAPGRARTDPAAGDVARDIPWAALWSDPVVRLCALVLAVLSLPYFLPLLPTEALARYSSDYVDQVQFPLLLLAMGYGMRRQKQPERRRFTSYLMCALGVWWAVRLSYLLWPFAPGTLVGDLSADVAYLSFYLFMILAIETRPHLGPGWSATDPTRKLATASVVVFLFTMLGYFVVVPSALNYDFYYTWLPSLYMYVALDLYLAARFFHSSATSGNHPYRGVYLMLGLASIGWAVFDLLECLSWAGVLEISDGTALDLLWWLPLPLLVVAARIPHVTGGATDVVVVDRRSSRTRSGTLRAVAPQVVVAFLIPVLHLVLYGTGLLDDRSRIAREVLVLVSLTISGVLILAQQVILERGNRALMSELREMNEQLEHSQKMEAIGRLAGGIAHDFNNLLTAILGHTRLVLDRLPPDSGVRGEIEAIGVASGRAASLTAQLLAFSRRQVLRPEVLDLNAVVSDTRQMVRRLIGEDIELLALHDPELGRIRADRGQLEQVILNLCVNARDAMPDGGTLIFETRNEHIPAPMPGQSHAAPEGPQVVLVVSDSGCGMQPETLERVFEPFFTTKELGRGTGLGLATVYGIVRQSGGFIHLESEPDVGTTFWIYFPREGTEPAATLQAKPVAKEETVTTPGVSDTTVLLVEDEDAVRELTAEILEMRGYTVLPACHGEEALETFDRHGGRVDLLLTDVVMPVMGGRELARKLLALEPSIKVLYVSGYANEAAFLDGHLESTAAFLPKPYTPDELAAKLREVLTRPAAPGVA